MNNFYAKAMRYELFIRKAHSCKSQLKYGAHLCYMQNLMNAEIGNSSVGHLPPASVQLADVKEHIENAINKLLQKKLSKNHEEKFNELLNKLDVAHSSSALMEIVIEGLELINSTKDL